MGCLPAPEEGDSGPGGLMSWFYMASLAGPAREAKESWISPATYPAPLLPAPKMAGRSQPGDANMTVVPIKTLKPWWYSMWLDKPRGLASVQKSWELLQDMGARAGIHKSRWLHLAG